ncbi:MAG: FAD:protein FMN transferase [Parachlamydiaceae bacterium]|nr:FAD:protein FMN transferase [Parachlamydiaceae bacterium]
MMYFFLFFLFCFTGCQNSSPHSSTVHFSQTRMTIDYNIIVGESLNEEKKRIVQQVIDQVFYEINVTFNKWNSYSEISVINALPENTPYHVSPALLQFFNRIDELVTLSGGLFDPTIEPLQKLWLVYLKQGLEPPIEEINRIKPSIGWNTIEIIEGDLIKKDKRTQLDFGGVAKGLCVDMLIERLSQEGLSNLYVEWGGEIRTSGMHPSNRPWRIFISHLGDRDPSKALAFLELNNQALATSGDYFQYWNVIDKNGDQKTYCHVFNPLTFSPLEVKVNSIASASLRAKDCVTADALAKVLMLFDSTSQAEEWVKYLQNEKGMDVACWIISRN